MVLTEYNENAVMDAIAKENRAEGFAEVTKAQAEKALKGTPVSPAVLFRLL